MQKKVKTISVFCLVLLGTTLNIFLGGCNKKNQLKVSSNKPLLAFQTRLLNIAFETASTMPLKPHVKNRSKAQEKVVKTCLALDQPELAEEYAKNIVNWRRAMCQAEIAHYYALNGDKVNALQSLEYANEMIEGKEFFQKWREKRIRTKIAKTHDLLGQSQKANIILSSIEDPNDKLAKAKTVASADESFAAKVETLDGLIKSGSFEIIIFSLQQYVKLHDEFYNDTEKRSFVEEKIRTSWNKIPYKIRVEILISLAENALTYKDNNKAYDLIDEIQEFLDNPNWSLEILFPLTAKLVELQFKANLPEEAIKEADTAVEKFQNIKDHITDIYRAETIRPLAEAYQKIGEVDKSLKVYKIAVEEGDSNRNSRPKVMDLSETCCSMALHSVEPDAELWARIEQISDGLGDPW